MKKDTLFIHGGPGLHCTVERALFGDTLPVLWWDQPALSPSATEGTSPFRTLVAQAGQQLAATAKSNGRAVDLIANSFGGQIAAALAREYPELIQHITLLGCSPDPIRQFFLLARRQLDAGFEHPGLRDALAAAEENCDESCFFALVQACYPNGILPDIYFGPNSTAARERYFAIAAPPMDATTFFLVMQEWLHTPPATLVIPYDGEVSILMGRHDPLLDVVVDQKKWRSIFPQAEFRTVDTGHAVHFELAPEAWCSKRL